VVKRDLVKIVELSIGVSREKEVEVLIKGDSTLTVVSHQLIG
jgi:hypothetical protein